MVLKADNPKWDDYICGLPADMQDQYFTSQYYKLEELLQTDANAQMFVYEESTDRTGIYAFIKRPIKYMELQGEYFDIETAYGYGGPLVNTEDTEFVRKFENAFLEYCRKERIVAEFIRFHPLLKNEAIFKQNIKVLHNRKTVVLDLEPDLEDIWMQQISKQNRNTIRKCIKNNLTVETTDDYDTFRDIYYETMKRVDAAGFYLFSQEYLEAFRNDAHSILLCVKSDQNIIAAAIFMGYGEYFHYHLSGSKKGYLRLAPNNILLWEAIKYAKLHGYKKMHLGGGLTNSAEDHLLQFKSHFSKNFGDFYIGKRVHNVEIYNTLIQRWEEENGRKAEILLQYRE